MPTAASIADNIVKTVNTTHRSDVTWTSGWSGQTTIVRPTIDKNEAKKLKTEISSVSSYLRGRVLEALARRCENNTLRFTDGAIDYLKSYFKSHDVDPKRIVNHQ